MAERKSNLLFIFTDEQRSDTLGCYGNDRIRTPNLNALARESFIFENAYVTQPICTPSRSTIMTGLYPHTTGCLRNSSRLAADMPTLAEMLSPDYVRGYIGKWHLGDEVIRQHGFDQWISIEDMYRGGYSKPVYLSEMSSYHHFLGQHGLTPDTKAAGALTFSRERAARLPEALTKAAFVGQAAAQFIEENRGRPFALYVNFLEPHEPFTGPLDGLYDPMTLPVGPHFAKRPAEDASLKNRLMAEFWRRRVKPDATPEAEWRATRSRYWGLVTLVDKAVGVILQALEKSGTAEHTIVVFTSDHGDMMGDHGLMEKFVLYEESVKVPLLIRAPWLGRTEHRIAGRISQVDLAPTLLDLMQIPIPAALEGESRLGVLAGDKHLAANDVIVEWNGPSYLDFDEPLLGYSREQMLAIDRLPWRSLIAADGWKLNLCSGDQCELYDLNRDHFEQANRFDDPGQKNRIQELAQRIRVWQKKTNDMVLLPAV